MWNWVQLIDGRQLFGDERRGDSYSPTKRWAFILRFPGGTVSTRIGRSNQRAVTVDVDDQRCYQRQAPPIAVVTVGGQGSAIAPPPGTGYHSAEANVSGGGGPSGIWMTADPVAPIDPALH